MKVLIKLENYIDNFDKNRSVRLIDIFLIWKNILLEFIVLIGKSHLQSTWPNINFYQWDNDEKNSIQAMLPSSYLPYKFYIFRWCLLFHEFIISHKMSICMNTLNSVNRSQLFSWGASNIRIRVYSFNFILLIQNNHQFLFSCESWKDRIGWLQTPSNWAFVFVLRTSTCWN